VSLIIRHFITISIALKTFLNIPVNWKTRCFEKYNQDHLILF